MPRKDPSTTSSAGSPHKVVALDDDGLLPLPKFIEGHLPSADFYEQRLVEYIRMVSLALDDLFVSRLRRALERLGDAVEVRDDGRTIAITKRGRPCIDITRAPPKTHARMLNKRENPEDHGEKERPRPKVSTLVAHRSTSRIV